MGNFSSAVFEMGNTKVVAAVYGPREVLLLQEGYYLCNTSSNFVYFPKLKMQFICFVSQVQNRSQQLSDQALVNTTDTLLPLTLIYIYMRNLGKLIMKNLYTCSNVLN